MTSSRPSAIAGIFLVLRRKKSRHRNAARPMCCLSITKNIPAPTVARNRRRLNVLDVVVSMPPGITAYGSYDGGTYWADVTRRQPVRPQLHPLPNIYFAMSRGALLCRNGRIASILFFSIVIIATNSGAKKEESLPLNWKNVTFSNP
jgi:hypothetical protein